MLRKSLRRRVEKEKNNIFVKYEKRCANIKIIVEATNLKKL